MDKIETPSLEQHENIIDAWVKEKNATVIYWHHGIKIWEYLLDCDEEIINGEMNNLVDQIKAGKIVNVRKDRIVDVKGTKLYPVMFEFKDMLCSTYFLVAKNGLINHLHLTPYLFRSDGKRDQFFAYINEHS